MSKKSSNEKPYTLEELDCLLREESDRLLHELDFGCGARVDCSSYAHGLLSIAVQTFPVGTYREGSTLLTNVNSVEIQDLPKKLSVGIGHFAEAGRYRLYYERCESVAIRNLIDEHIALVQNILRSNFPNAE